ncbi:glutamate receptor 2.8-like [Canna indica]|uniref:Glutamate receptor n=1 Tax=Canna indica TaxID=4628 RepID=A0AAQ3JTU3_9LILI|nr:glutamate receptor 2.8-like [Canna indica]
MREQAQRHVHLTSFLLFLSSLLPLSAAPPPLPPLHASSAAATFKVGLILDMTSSVGKVCRTATRMAVDDFYAAYPNSTSRLRLLPRDSSRDVVNAADAALDLLTNEKVHAILGPQTSVEAPFVSDLGAAAHVPVVSFSATSPAVSPARSPYFVRAGASDAAQVRAIAAIIQAFNWRRVVPIYEDSDYGTALVPFLVDALGEVDAAVPYRCALSPSSTKDHISAELYRLKTLQTRVFVVHVTAPLALLLFPLIQQAEMMSDGFVWILTEGLTSQLGSIDPFYFVRDTMQGVLGLKPYIPMTGPLKDFKRRWRREFLKEDPESDITDLSNFGIWAYDAVWAVAAAAQRLGAAVGPDFLRRSNSSRATDFSKLGVSKTGPKLLDYIKTTEFEGLGGRFRLQDGQLNVTAYQIMNVNGEKAREIGFWTAKYGLRRELNLSSAKAYSANRDGLRPVIWPGYSTAVPRGWVTPTSGRKLRIAVPGPVEPGFHSFLNVERDPDTNDTRASGFVVEVFEAAVRRLPYALLFQYESFRNASGTSAGDYNDLVHRVFDKQYDAVVGDVTITANRSNFVDFTLPYTVSGVSMVVPLRDQHSKNAWIFLKPLTSDLWLVSAAFFIFTGSVVWILEHRRNTEFQGTAGQQMGTVFYFSFSTLVFSHRENLVSNLSRVVVIIWVFVVLILQSSYIASLTSMLTVQQFAPTVSSFEELKNSGHNVGYLRNSFTKGLLLKLGFEETKLKPFHSPQQYQEALSNRSVAAIVDEIPYLRVFLKDYCGNYTMAGQTYKTGGFGFVFPKGSPLVSDLSRAILNLTEGDEMVEIERRWFGDQTSCTNQGSTLSSDSSSLDFNSFWGLFLITGTVSFVCCLIYLLRSAYRNRRSFRDITAEQSFRKRLISIARLLDGRSNCAPERRNDERKEIGSTMVGESPSASPYSNYQESQTSISNDTFDGGSPFSELGRSLPETRLHAEVDEGSY